jgi:hypothetical protein
VGEVSSALRDKEADQKQKEEGDVENYKITTSKRENEREKKLFVVIFCFPLFFGNLFTLFNLKLSFFFVL